MSEGPRNGEWDWLYDQPGTPQSRAGRPTGRSSADLPPPNLPPPGARKAKPPRRPRKRRPGRVLAVLIVAWLLYLLAVPAWAFATLERVPAEPQADRPDSQPGHTYLLVGSDSRKNLSARERKDLATGKADGERADTLMLMHVGRGPTLLMSIPRDSRVEIPGRGVNKINAAYAYGGPKLLVQTVEHATGIRVDDYVEIGFAGFVSIVDALNGVEICPKKSIRDPKAGIDLKAGCQDVDGKNALGYSRSRKTYATSDIQRMQSQREVLGAIAKKSKSPWTVVNPVRYWRFANGASKSLTVGDNVGPFSLARFAWNLSGAMSGGGLNCTVPLADFSVRWDADRSAEMFKFIKSDNTAGIGKLCTPDGIVR